MNCISTKGDNNECALMFPMLDPSTYFLYFLSSKCSGKHTLSNQIAFHCPYSCITPLLILLISNPINVGFAPKQDHVPFECKSLFA